jgi:hypothetical protein
LTPKEKAKELTNSLYQPLGYLQCGVSSNMMWEQAKKFATICVDEILAIIHLIREAIGIESDGYWEQVQSEIEKL